MNQIPNPQPTYEGNTKPTSIEQDIHEKDLFAARFTEIPSNQQMRCDYDGRTDGQPVYIGFGAKGLASSADGWLLQKFTYDGSNFVTLRQIFYGIWDSRTGYTYE